MRRLTTLLLAGALALPLGASALTLQDLNAGASFTSTGGELSFDFAPGSIALSGTLPADLSQYTVLATATGFAISGPVAAIGPAAFGGLVLGYRVSAAPGLALEGADLQTAGIAFGPGAVAIASSGYSNGASLGVLLAPSGGTGSAVGASFGAIASLDALASIQLFAMTPGDVAAFGVVQHGFTWAALPEPGAMSLLATGLLGLAWLGSRRAPRRPRE